LDGESTQGFPLLAQALAGSEKFNHPILISLSSGPSPIHIPIPHLHLGPIHDDCFLSFAYSAADLIVISSLQDNLPNAVLEAIACGTPVMGFAVGGIPDMVRPGITGLLVTPQEVSGLSAAIGELLRDPVRRADKARNCRRIAVEEYGLELQARRYLDIYETQVNAQRPQ